MHIDIKWNKEFFFYPLVVQENFVKQKTMNIWHKAACVIICAGEGPVCIYYNLLKIAEVILFHF